MTRRTTYLLAALILAGSVGSILNAVKQFNDPMPAWMTSAEQWYEHAIAAGVGVTAGIACIVYDRRRARLERPGPHSSSPRRWRDNVELRVVIYCIAGSLLLGVPIAVFKTLRAMAVSRPPGHDSFWSLFPIDYLVGALVAIAVIAFDRRRLRREALEDSNERPD